MSAPHILIRNARIVRSAERVMEDADILIDTESGRIVKIDKKITLDENISAKVINAAGHPVCHAFTDLYSRSGEPVYAYRDSITKTAQSAAAGGYSRIVLVPEIPDGTSETAVIRHIKAHSQRCDCGVICASPIASRRSGSSSLVSFSTAISDGAEVFFADGNEPPNMLRDAMIRCKSAGYTLIVRCREGIMYGSGAVAEGYISKAMKVPGIPKSAETLALSKIILLSKETGCPVHAAFLSLKESFEMVRRAKEEGINITCSVSPFHFAFSENDIIFYGQNAKLDPPLRSDEDRSALINAIADGTIDAIVSDHTPCASNEKKQGIKEAPFGAVSLQSAFLLAVNSLLAPGHIDIFTLCSLFADAPSKIIGRSSEIKEGESADLVILSLEKKTAITSQFLKSSAKNTPCIGMTLAGKLTHCIINGKLIN